MDKQDLEKARQIIKECMALGRKSLSEYDSKRVLSLFKIPVPASVFVDKTGNLESAAAGLRPPYILKIVSPDIIHKSDTGAVTSPIESCLELRGAAEEIRRAVYRTCRNAVISGFLLEEYAPNGIEIIAGGTRDPQFGPVITFGAGGIMVELLRDVSFRIAPVTTKDAYDMVSETKVYRLLSGYRGGGAYDIKGITEVITKLSLLMSELKDVADFEINPLVVYKEGVMAVDAGGFLKSGD